jgi:hypothetical protein
MRFYSTASDFCSSKKEIKKLQRNLKYIEKTLFLFYPKITSKDDTSYIVFG